MTAEHAHALDAGGAVEALSEALYDDGLEEILGVHDEQLDDVASVVLASRWLANDRAVTRATAADTILAEAHRLCCGDNPAPHHAATDAHSTRMAFAEELARAVRGS